MKRDICLFDMTTTTPQDAAKASAAAFGQALRTARSQADMSQTELVAKMGDTTGLAHQSRISGAEDGGLFRIAGDVADIRQLETTLGVTPGALSHHLGFVPPETKRTPELAIEQDDRLTRVQKDLVIGFLQQLLD